MEKKLYKSNQNKMICGVCGGIGEYFGIDPTIIRLAWAIFCLMGGSGILALHPGCGDHSLQSGDCCLIGFENSFPLRMRSGRFFDKPD